MRATLLTITKILIAIVAVCLVILSNVIKQSHNPEMLELWHELNESEK